MKKPNFFKRIHLSITSKSYYKLVLSEHFFKAFIYLVLLSILSIIPAAVKNGYQVSNFMTLASKILSDPECPDFVIEGNKLQFTEDKSFVYEDDSNDLIVIFNPNNEYSLNNLAGHDIGYLITPNKLIISSQGIEPIPRDYSMISSMMQKITKTQMEGMLRTFAPVTFAFFTFFVIAVAVAYSLFLSLFASLIAVMSRNVCRIRLSYSSAYKIAIYSMTAPVILLSLLYLVLPSVAINGGFIIFVFTTTYFTGSVMSYLRDLTSA